MIKTKRLDEVELVGDELLVAAAVDGAGILVATRVAERLAAAPSGIETEYRANGIDFHGG